MHIIEVHDTMLLSLWIVLLLIGLTVAVKVVIGLRGKLNLGHVAETLTRPLLIDIFPLILLSWLAAIDPTHVLIFIWYFLAALFIALRTLVELVRLLRNLI